MTPASPTIDRLSSPRLTIGMPVYNSGRTVGRALDSLLAQSYADFHLVVSDDGSTDETVSVCEAVARHDSRVEVVRQPTNLNYGNFRYVLGRAETPLFMFAAGDDYWHPEYARRMIDVLDRQSDVVCAVSRVDFVKDGVSVARAHGTEALMADSRSNIAQFLAAGDDNSRMYGVFRTAAAKRAFPDRDFFGYDWAFSIGTLRDGKHAEVPDVLLWRDYTRPDRYVEYVRRDADGALNRILPMLPLTRDLVGRLRVPMTTDIMRQLVRVNLAFHLAYLRRFHPTAAGVSGRVARGLSRVVGAVVRSAR